MAQPALTVQCCAPIFLVNSIYFIIIIGITLVFGFNRNRRNKVNIRVVVYFSGVHDVLVVNTFQMTSLDEASAIPWPYPYDYLKKDNVNRVRKWCCEKC